MKFDPRVVANFIAFQVAWFACVLGAANDLALAGTLTVVAAVGLHLRLAPRPQPEFLLIAIAALVGTVWDSLLVSVGLMVYPTGNFAPGVAPHWIIGMWALFATTLNVSMAWMKGRPALAAAMGAVGGPLAYLAGQRLGAVVMPDAAVALGIQAGGWAVMMPLLTVVAARLDGFEPRPAAERHSTGGRHV
jgi:hypothetical protein